jgi:hypothetical protein
MCLQLENRLHSRQGAHGALRRPARLLAPLAGGASPLPTLVFLVV